MVTVPKVKNGVKISYLSLKHDNLNVLLRIIHRGCSHIITHSLFTYYISKERRYERPLVFKIRALDQTRSDQSIREPLQDKV